NAMLRIGAAKESCRKVGDFEENISHILLVARGAAVTMHVHVLESETAATEPIAGALSQLRQGLCPNPGVDAVSVGVERRLRVIMMEQLGGIVLNINA